MTQQRKDKRGARPGDPTKPRHHKRDGTPHEGKIGNVAHEYNPEAAAQIEILSGYGLPQNQIVDFLEATFDDQGYSQDTIQRHYRAEIDRGKAKAKVTLIRGAYDMAMGRNKPDGVSADTAFREQSRKIEFLLNVVHKMVPYTGQHLSGPDGGAIPIANIDLSNLTDDDLDALERISQRLDQPGDDKG